MDENCVIQTEHLSKEYRLGVIGSGTLRRDLQSFWAEKRGKEDPNKKIGSKSFDKNDSFLALNDLSISVNRGERIGIIGANGAGKSTFLKLLSRVTSPTSGSFSYRGRIASMLEVGTGFHGELTGRENIYLNGAILGMSKAEINSKIDDIVSFSECEKFIDTPIKRYSSGMVVKLAFSVAAHLNAEILIMDEVLAVGDVRFQNKCISKMRELALNEDRTILYVSHNMNTIRELCTRCIFLDRGKAIFDGDVEEAIKIYLGGEKENFVFHDYTKGDPHRIKAERQDINLVSAKYIGKSDNIFSNDEQLELELCWKALKDVPELCLRVEVADNRRYPVTAYVIENICSCNAGKEYKKSFSLNISSIANGRYYTRYVFYNRKSDVLPFETVENVAGLLFRRKRPQNNNLQWNKQWGSVIMDEITLLE